MFGMLFLAGFLLGFCVAGGLGYAVWRYVLPRLHS